MPKVRVDFYLSGDNADLDDITERMELIPTSSRKKMEWPQASINAGIAKDAWLYEMEKEECKAISKQLNKLQEILSPKTDVIRDLCNIYSLKASITIVVEMECNDGPEFVLTQNNIAFLSSINAEIGFDLYMD